MFQHKHYAQIYLDVTLPPKNILISVNHITPRLKLIPGGVIKPLQPPSTHTACSTKKPECLKQLNFKSYFNLMKIRKFISE